MELQTGKVAPDTMPCPSCGAPAATGAEGKYVECEVCGLVPVSVSAEQVAEQEALAEGAVRCQWCGAANPPELERCRMCNAAFPNPDMDLAMLKAAEDRLRALEDEITLREQQRKHGLFGKLFG